MKQIRVRRSCATRWLELHRVEVAERRRSARRASRGTATSSGSSSGRIGRISERRAVLGGPGGDVLRRIGADRGPGQLVLGRPPGRAAITRASSASRPSGEASSGLMSISLIQRLLDDQLAEAHQELLERREVDRLAAAHALAAPCRSGSAPSSAGPASCSAAAGPSARSLKTSTSWPPVPKSSTGPNCGSRLLPTISS